MPSSSNNLYLMKCQVFKKIILWKPSSFLVRFNFQKEFDRQNDTELSGNLYGFSETLKFLIEVSTDIYQYEH